MVDIEYSTYNCEFSKIIIGTKIKNPEMLKFVPDHLTTKKMCKHAVKKIRFLLTYASDQYKTQQMFDKVILENGGTVRFCCRNQEMGNKAVDNYPHALKSVPNCYITQKMCDKAANTHHSTIKFVPECCKTQEMCDKAVNIFSI